MFLSATNALLYYTYKMLKYAVKISHDCSYMFQSIWTIIMEPMANLAKVTILCRYSVKIRRYMFSNVGKKCFKLWCVLCAVQFVTLLLLLLLLLSSSSSSSSYSLKVLGLVPRAGPIKTGEVF